MKKYLPLALTLLFAFASVALGQDATKAEASPSPSPKPAMSKAQVQRSLIATEKKLWEAWKNKDAKPFRATLAADSVMVGDSGVSGKAQAIKDITSMPCEVKSVSLSDFKLSMPNSGTAFLTYKGAAEGTCAGAPIPVVWASSLYVNRGGKWYAYTHQETPVR